MKLKNMYLILVSLFIGAVVLTVIPQGLTGYNELYQEKVGIKNIYIIRHAKSSHTDPTLNDFDRPLDEKGVQNALSMGLYLKDKAPNLELMICSPALRTQQTAKLISEQMNFDLNQMVLDSSLYNCNVETYLKVIQHTDDKYNNVAFVSHNPSTTYISNLLQKNENFSEVTTGAVVAIQFKVKTWHEIKEGKGELLFTKDPDDIGKQGD